MSMHADIKDTYSAQHTYYTQVTQSDVCSAILYVCLTPTRGMHTIPSNCMSKLSSSSYSMCVGGVVHAYNSLCMSLRGFFYMWYIYFYPFLFFPPLFSVLQSKWYFVSFCEVQLLLLCPLQVFEPSSWMWIVVRLEYDFKRWSEIFYCTYIALNVWMICVRFV